jgi:hypothetical protein
MRLNNELGGKPPFGGDQSKWANHGALIRVERDTLTLKFKRFQSIYCEP